MERRYQDEGPTVCEDRSSARGQPERHPAEVIDKIVHLRQNYHFGPAKIAMYLKRYHDIESATPASGGSSSG